MKYWEITEGGAYEIIPASTLDDALETAIDWAKEGDWPTYEGPCYIEVRVWEVDKEGNRLDDGEDGYADIVLPMDEPDCISEHDWQSPHEIVGGIKENPGVWGNGGGVIINECCMNCGCKRTTDTWATNPSNGSQGHREVTYEADFYEILEEEI